ncbi:MAG: hypothetical protein DCF22_04465 [Leptolyngbya sp.]|nr:MAG: hypothetical protein DCF22_04465 [Leptolyngbya sp.]
MANGGWRTQNSIFAWQATKHNRDLELPSYSFSVSQKKKSDLRRTPCYSLNTRKKSLTVTDRHPVQLAGR